MTTISFFARGDSGSANNASLNAQGATTTPVTELVFSSGDLGDIKLDYNGGFSDPNTTVIINGVEMAFTVEFTGNLPITNKLSNVNGTDLRGEQIVVISAANGQRYFFLSDGSGTLQTMETFPNGAHAITAVTSGGAPVLVCFLRGTLIATPEGERRVETLRIGDLVLNGDGMAVPVSWIAYRRVTTDEVRRYPELRPVCIPAGHFGPGMPHSALHLSPQHRVVVDGWPVELMFGNTDMLVPARHLLDGAVTLTEGDGPFDYFHLLLEDHDIVISNGLRTESYQPSARVVDGLDAALRRELELLFPQAGLTRLMQREDIYPTLRAHEARAVTAMLQAPALKSPALHTTDMLAKAA